MCINKIYGIVDDSSLPHFLIDSIIGEYEKSPMEIGDRYQELKPSHMILVSIIKRIYFLSKTGYKEDDFIKSFGSKQDRVLAGKILKILHREKILSKTPDEILQPKSFHRKRMIELLQKLENSDDKLWKEIGNLC